MGEYFDGVKMDIEGSELELLDQWLIPPCQKLCFEYHTSRDPNMARLDRRLRNLKKRFELVSYVPELDRMVAAGGEQKAFHDRVIYCKNRKTPVR